MNVVGGVRWSCAFAYLEAARGRDNLTVLGDTLIDRLVIEGGRCAAVQTANGQRLESARGGSRRRGVLQPGNPDAQRHRAGRRPARSGSRWPSTSPSASGSSIITGRGLAGATAALDAACAEHEAAAGPLFEPHAFVKGASSSCTPGSWDLMLLSWLTPPTGDRASYAFTMSVFHMKPASHGRLRLRSVDPGDPPIVERGFFTDAADLPVVVEGIELARVVAGNEPLRQLLGTSCAPAAPTSTSTRGGARATTSIQPGRAPIGSVVDGLRPRARHRRASS